MNPHHPESAPASVFPAGRHGSDGERRIQEELGTTDRADRFYQDQMRDRLNTRMREFVARQEMLFLSTADGSGACDSTFRAGPPGFVLVLDDRTIAYPEYRGNGVMASLGNIRENPHVGILMIDFGRDRIGLHINGTARLVSDELMRIWRPELPVDPVPGRRPQMWVQVDVDEAYIHCSKHIPHLVKAPKIIGQRTGSSGGRAWGTDDNRRKGGDFFGTVAEGRLARVQAAEAPVAPEAEVVVAPVPAAVVATVPEVVVAEAAPEAGDVVAGADVVVAAAVKEPPKPKPPPKPGPPPSAPSAPAARSTPSATPSAARDADPVKPVSREEPVCAVRTQRMHRAVKAGLPDPEVWRREAEQALATAYRRGLGVAAETVESAPGGPGFRGWFG